MSIINRNNYEIYFLDYLEGNLSPELRKELDLFLITNPDLKDELEGMEDVSLPEEKVVFTSKESLKNISLPKRPDRFLTDDDFIIAKVEGDLAPDEEFVFESYIKTNPLIEKDYSLFKLTKLTSDESIVFEDKSLLKLQNVNTDIRPVALPSRFTSDDEFMVAKFEGDLTDQEEILFDSYIKENSRLRNEYALFMLTRLEPDESVVFEHKSSLKRFEIPSRYQVLRKYAFAVASVAAVILFVAIFFYEKEEPVITPENQNYLSLIHRSPRNIDNGYSENKITFTGTPVSNEKENKTIYMEIKVQKTLHADLNKTATDDQITKEKDSDQNGKAQNLNENNPEIAQNIHSQDKDENKNQHNYQLPKNPVTDQQVNKPVQTQNVKKTADSDNNLSFWKIAAMSIRGLSNMTGKKMELNKQYDANGNVKALAFNSSRLEISAPVKKK